MPKLLIMVNNPATFLSHRLGIALAAAKKGFEVHIASMDGAPVEEIKQHGFAHHVLPLSRSGKNPWHELKTLFSIYKLFKRIRPDIVHLVTIKPVLYGGIAARLAKVACVVQAISGLGFLFTHDKKIDPIKTLVQLIYRSALKHHNSKVIFQNKDDLQVLNNLGALQPNQAVMIYGSGVDLEQYTPAPEPAEPPVVAVFVARLLKDKGAYEYFEAATLSQANQDNIIWRVIGSPDMGNPTSLTVEEVEQCTAIEYLGHRTDIAQQYARAHIAVLPSYREGLPRSLIEAGACARAIVTTNVPGCKDAIQNNVTGILVPARDSHALYQAVKTLAEDAPKRQAMGAAGRVYAQANFDVNQVIAKHLEVYDQLLAAVK